MRCSVSAFTCLSTMSRFAGFSMLVSVVLDIRVLI